MPITDDFSVGSPANGTALSSYNGGKFAYEIGGTNTTDYQIQSNRAAMRQGSVDVMMRRTDGTFPDDQYAQVTIPVAMNAGGEYMGVAVRVQSSGGDGGYGFFQGPSAPELFVIDSGSWSALASPGSRASTANDKLKLTVAGGLLTPTIDQGSGFSTTGAPAATSDATFTSGAPGLTGYNQANNPSIGRLDDFEASDLAGAGANEGTLSKTLDAVTISAAGTSTVTGSLSQTLDAVSLSATGTSEVSGALSQTLDVVGLTATGAGEVTGALSATLDVVSLAATGSSDLTGSLDATLDAITLTAAGTVEATGSLALTLDLVTLEATGEEEELEEITGTLAITLDPVIASASVYLPVARPGQHYSTQIAGPASTHISSGATTAITSQVEV